MQVCYELCALCPQSYTTVLSSWKVLRHWETDGEVESRKERGGWETDPDAPVAAARELSPAQRNPEGSSLKAMSIVETSEGRRGHGIW